MPIRINLLAEAHAADEARRKDPLKRGLSIAGLLVGGMLLWGGFEYWMTRAASAQLQNHENEWKRIEPSFKAITAQQKELDTIEARLTSLTRLATNRFLWGTALNNFQQTSIDQIQFMRLGGSQIFADRKDPDISRDGKKIPGKLRASEKITITIEAKDYGSQSDENYNKLRRAIFKTPYFSTNLPSADAIRLARLNLVPTPEPDGRSYTTFILECQMPERLREP